MGANTYLRIPHLGVVTDYPDNRLCLTNAGAVLDVSTPIYARTPDCFFVKIYELTANWMDRQRDYRVTSFCEKKICAGMRLFTGQDNTRLSKIGYASDVPATWAFLSFKLKGPAIDVLRIGKEGQFLYAVGREQLWHMPLVSPEDLYFFTYATLDLAGFTVSHSGVVPLKGQPIASGRSYFEHDPSISVSGLYQLQQVLPLLVQNLYN